MATVAWTATGDTSFSFTARRWSPWLPTSARTFLPVLSVISVSPAKAALSRPWIEGRLSKNDCAYASAASPITRSTASAAPSPRSRAVRRIFCPIGDHAAWIRARGLCPPFVLIRSGTFRAMFGGAQDSTLSHSHQRRPNGEGYAARPRPIRARRPAFAKSSRPRFRGPLAGAGIHLLGRHQTLLACAWKMNSNARPAWASKLPARGVKLGRVGQVGGVRDPDAVGEGQALRPRARETQSHLASRLQVEGVVVEGAGVSAGDELDDRRELTLAHRGFEVGPGGALGQPAPAAQLGQEHIPLAAQGGEIRLQRPHLFANRGHALLEVGGVQLGQIVGHCRNPRSRVRLGGCGKQQKAPRRKRFSARRPRKRAERTPPLRWRCRQARARKPGRRRAPLRSTPPPPDGRRVARSRRCRPGARGRPSETEGIARAGAQLPRRGWDRTRRGAAGRCQAGA